MLKGLLEAISSVFPETEIQLCVVHQIRNSLKHISYKVRPELMNDLKAI
jgi:putative transposase